MQDMTAEFPADLEEVPGSQPLIMFRRWYSVVVFIPADNKSSHSNNNCSPWVYFPPNAPGGVAF